MRLAATQSLQLMHYGRNLLVLVLLVCVGDTGRRFVAGAGQADSLDIEQIAQRDLYAVLELEPGVPAADVKAAYRKLARAWHPDKNPQDTQVAQRKFAEIAEAYEVLSDETSRELYDHARRVRAASRHHRTSNFNFEHDVGGAEDGGEAGAGYGWASNAQWYQQYADGMGMGDDGGFFGSSFEAGGPGFNAAFGSESFGGVGGGDGGSWGGGVFEYHPRDPLELFETLFGSIYGLDGYEEVGDQHVYTPEHREAFQHAAPWGDQIEELFDFDDDIPRQPRYAEQDQQQQQKQRQQNPRLRPQQRQEPEDFFSEDRFQERSGSRGSQPWIGQDFEQYHDYEVSGRKYRRVITTTLGEYGASSSIAQEFVFDEQSRRWMEVGAPVEYYGPGVGGKGSNEPVDNVLRIGEFLRVGRSITTVDRKFTATLDRNCNFAVLTHRGRGKNRTTSTVWETGSFDALGHCFAMVQDNGMFVIMSGDDPSTAGNVLWSNNRPFVGWFRQRSFHASLLPNGNLVVSQGESPMHPAAKKCLWGAFGCPGEGGVQEWKLVWISFRTHADQIWCKIINHWSDDEGEDSDFDYDQHAYFPGQSTGRDEHMWHKTTTSAQKLPIEIFESSAATAKHLLERGLSKTREVWEKVKNAAEETAHAASRPRHW